MVGLSPSLLALTFGLHITMVNLGIGLAWLVPYFKWRAERGEKELEAVARSLMRFYAATYGIAGVFGTAFTVFLLSYYPRFLGFAGNITMLPFGLSILMIALHFFSITSFWYGWDRWSKRTHQLIGALLALSATLIPLGFRAVFAFLNIPAGLGYDPETGKFYLDTILALTKNPTFIPLYIKSITAAFTATFLLVAGVYAYKYYTLSGKEKEVALRVVKTLAKPIGIGLGLMLVLGLWYAFSLKTTPYKFNNIFAPLGWRIRGGEAYFNTSWLFILKILLYIFQVAVVTLTLPKILRGKGSKTHGKLLLYAGLAALLTIAIGEYLNAFSQYPFFIAAWPDILANNLPLDKLPDYGVNIPQASLNTVINTVNSIALLENTKTTNKILERLGISQYFPSTSTVNEIAVEEPVVALTIGFLALLLLAAAYLVYILLTPAKKAEEQVPRTY